MRQFDYCHSTPSAFPEHISKELLQIAQPAHETIRNGVSPVVENTVASRTHQRQSHLNHRRDLCPAFHGRRRRRSRNVVVDTWPEAAVRNGGGGGRWRPEAGRCRRPDTSTTEAVSDAPPPLPGPPPDRRRRRPDWTMESSDVTRIMWPRCLWRPKVSPPPEISETDLSGGGSHFQVFSGEKVFVLFSCIILCIMFCMFFMYLKHHWRRTVFVQGEEDLGIFNGVDLVSEKCPKGSFIGKCYWSHHCYEVYWLLLTFYRTHNFNEMFEKKWCGQIHAFSKLTWSNFDRK